MAAPGMNDVQSSVFDTMTGVHHVRVPSANEAGRNKNAVRDVRRIASILNACREPSCWTDIVKETNFEIPIPTMYRLLNAMTEVGWLVITSRSVNKFGKSMRMWVTAKDALLLPYPRPCPKCHMTMYSAEAERSHVGSSLCR